MNVNKSALNWTQVCPLHWKTQLSKSWGRYSSLNVYSWQKDSKCCKETVTYIIKLLLKFNLCFLAKILFNFTFVNTSHGCLCFNYEEIFAKRIFFVWSMQRHHSCSGWWLNYFPIALVWASYAAHLSGGRSHLATHPFYV